MFGIQPLRTNQTVPVSNENEGNDEKTAENEINQENRKKRTWTPAREAAWEKCLEGRKRYVETKKEITAKEEEDRKLKEKIRLEMIKKQIRAEIEAEMQTDKEQHDISVDCHQSSAEEDKKEEMVDKKAKVKIVEEPKIEKKSKKRYVRYESSSSDSSTDIDSEEERRIRRKKKLKKKMKKSKRKTISDSDESSSCEETLSRKSVTDTPKRLRAPPNSYLNRFSFV